MLDKFRNHIQGWLAWCLILIICFTFGLWGIGNYLQGNQTSNLVAKVNNHPISSQMLDQAYTQLLHQETTQNPQEIKSLLREKALNQLITNYLLIEDALQMGLRIAPVSVQKTIESYLQNLANPKLFQQTLQALHLTLKGFTEEVRQQLLLEQIYKTFLASSIAFPEEITQHLASQNQSREGSYAIIKVPNTHLTPSKEALTHYYHTHQADYQAPEKAQLAYLELSKSQLVKNKVIREEALKQYYEENKRELGLKEFNQVKDKIRQHLIQETMIQNFNQTADQLTNLSYEYPTSLTEIAKTFNLTIKTTPIFSRNAIPQQGVLKWLPVRQQIFKESLLAGNNSEVILLDNATLVIIRLAKYEPAHVKPFSEVKQSIQTILTKQLKEQADFTAAKKLAAMINQNHSDSILGSLKWQPLVVKPQNTTFISGIVDTLFALSLEPHHHAQGISLPNGEAAIVVLKNIINPSPETFTLLDKIKAQRELTHFYGNAEYNLYKKGVKERGKIKRYLPPQDHSEN